jgi:nucleotidyltransferase substrate binding protein (TIGR01987 family)
MEKLNTARKAHHTLVQAIAFPKHELKRDAVVQRFEYTADSAWKAAKEILLRHHSLDVRYPKEAFQKTFLVGLISENLCAALLSAVDDRNYTSHTYSEIKVTEIYGRIPAHSDAFGELLTALEQS